MSKVEAPVLTINDIPYKMTDPKSRVWREVTKLQEEEPSIDNWAKIIAISFSNNDITEDDVLDNVRISELMPLSLACVNYVNALVNEKLENVLAKNAGKAEEVPAE